MPYLLSLDEGTTSARAALYDQSGARIAMESRPIECRFPHPGWVEQDALAIWQAQLDAARAVLANAHIPASGITAIGIANQRETTVVWDRRTGQPVSPAIVWQCRRTAEACHRLANSPAATDITRRTGLVIDAYFSASKIQWILDNVPGARARACDGELLFGTIDTWLIWRLTNGRVHATDPTNASRTMLMNLSTGEWESTLTGIFDIPRAMLPQIVPSSSIVGVTSAEHLGAEIPIAGIAGDQQAALAGQACFRAGLSKNTYGTGCFALLHTGPREPVSQNRLLSTRAASVSGNTRTTERVGSVFPATAGDAAAPCALFSNSRTTERGGGVFPAPAEDAAAPCALSGDAQFAIEGSVFIAGAAVQWLRDKLGLIQAAAESEALALSVPDSGGVYLVPAFVGLGAPHWDSAARGLLTGLSLSSDRPRLVRAALESIAYQTRELVEAMEADSGEKLKELRVDGGAAANNFLMQFQADILGCPIVRPTDIETTALGAAYLAGLATGFFPSVAAVETFWRAERIFEPQMTADRRDTLFAGWKDAVRRARLA
ncbi:MAG: glycerol kinase [Bryobacteraceae bacterium]